jgi:hypothetical protein
MSNDELTVGLPIDLSLDADDTVYGGTALVHLHGGAILRTSPAAAAIVDAWLDGHTTEPDVTLLLPTYPPGESIGVGRSGTARVRLTAVIAVEMPWIKPDHNW